MHEKVLVIDDDGTAGNVLKWAMESMGHQVEVALDGVQAIEITKNFIPDVVLCDINMPKMLGYEVCQHMKSDPRLRHTLFIAQTGLDSQASMELSQKSGFQYHLVKPIDINSLLELVFLERMLLQRKPA